MNITFDEDTIEDLEDEISSCMQCLWEDTLTSTVDVISIDDLQKILQRYIPKIKLK